LQLTLDAYFSHLQQHCICCSRLLHIQYNWLTDYQLVSAVTLFICFKYDIIPPTLHNTSSTGSVIAWVSEIRYLGVYFSRFRRFKCSIDHAKRLFYKAANSVFSTIGRIASEEVTLQLVTRNSAIVSHNRILWTSKSEGAVIGNKKMRCRYVKADYRQTRSIARPLRDS